VNRSSLTAIISLFMWSALSWGQEVLENGRIRLELDRRSGLFDVTSSTGGGMRLLAAGPAFEKDGRTVSTGESKPAEVRRERFEDAIGAGERLVVRYPAFRYELNLYAGKPWFSATAYLPKGGYALGDVRVIEGKLRVPDAFKTRLYISSGTAGDNSGVWELGMRRWSSSAVSVLYEPRTREAIGFGFYSFHRASSSVTSQYLGSDEIGVSAAAHYNGYRPQNEELRTESVLVNFSLDPLAILEEWADNIVKVVQPKFLHDTRTSFINTWYAFGDKATSSLELEQAKILRESPLYGYGVRYVELGEWQKQRNGPGDSGDALGYGEDEVDETLFPQGLAWLCGQYHELGFGCSYGANYAYAALSTSTAKRNPLWLIKEDLSRLDFGYPIDFTHPDAQKWVYELYRRAIGIGAKWVWSDFDGGPARGKLYDSDKVMGFEDIREGMKAIRRAVGSDTFIHKFCCGPYFTYIGLADRVRTGDDTHALGDFEGLQAMARQQAATYMLHQRLWINDPDPVFVGGREFVNNPNTGPIPGDVAILHEVRMRLQYQLASGGFVTIGENLEDFDQERMRLLTLVLPPYGQAARPLDLFEHTTPEIYDLNVKTVWEDWHVLLLQNWTGEDKIYPIRFSRLGLDDNRSYLVFRFWDQTFLGQFRESASLKAGARQGEAFAIREAPEHPWLLSTDMHLSQGGVEIEDVRFDASSKRLTGTARRHAGATGHVVVYAPPGYIVRSASGPYREQQQPSGARVVVLELKFETADSPWYISFS